MRRTIALLLLTLFTWMLIAPWFVPNAKAGLPPCCRKHGKHHCMMQMMLGQSSLTESANGYAACEVKSNRRSFDFVWRSTGLVARQISLRMTTSRR